MSEKLSPRQPITPNASTLSSVKEKNAPTRSDPRYFSIELLRLHSLLKCLSKCHVFIALVMLILSALADYLSHRINTLRLHGLQEICSAYCILMGITGIFGSASHRRALIITFMVMGFHAVIIFTPVIIVVSSFDIHFYHKECWASCDWHLLSASVPKDSRCQILCGANIDENKRHTMTRLGTNYILDAGLISLAGLELLLSIVTTILCIKQVFGLCSMNDGLDNSTTHLELEPLHNNDSAKRDV